MAVRRAHGVKLSPELEGVAGRSPPQVGLKIMYRSGRHGKRERSQNWGQVEKCVLVRLVQKRLAVIEDKAGDTDAVQRRLQAWRDIHAEFTAKVGSRVGGVQRNVQRMREQWRRIKHWARQEMNFFRESEALGNTGLKKPNELAHYICEMMCNFERKVIGFPSFGDSVLSDEEPPRPQDTFQAAEPLQSPLPNHQTQQELITAEASGVSNDDVPVDVQVKQESVDLLDDDEASVTIVTVPPNRLVHQQPRGQENGLTSSGKPALPGWTKDFPETVDEDAAPPTANLGEEEEDDDDDSDFLEDSDDDDDLMGSFSDWGREQPVTVRALEKPLADSVGSDRARVRSDPGHTLNARLDKQRLLFGRREFKRRMEMIEAEHSRKMQILELQRETAQMKKKLAFRQLKQSRTPSSATSNPYGRRVYMQR